MPNNAAIATDTSSSAAATIPVVDTAVAELAALIDVVIRATSEAATVNNSGVTLTNDIPHHPDNPFMESLSPRSMRLYPQVKEL
ncbi:hypothetical protein MYBA111488_10530 [Mycobacterium basiliense]